MVKFIDPTKMWKYKHCFMCGEYNLRSKWEKNKGSCPSCGSDGR